MGTEKKGKLVTLELSEQAWERLHQRAVREGESDEAVISRIAERELGGAEAERVREDSKERSTERLKALNEIVEAARARAGRYPPGHMVEVVHDNLDGDAE